MFHISVYELTRLTSLFTVHSCWSSSNHPSVLWLIFSFWAVTGFSSFLRKSTCSNWLQSTFVSFIWRYHQVQIDLKSHIWHVANRLKQDMKAHCSGPLIRWWMDTIPAFIQPAGDVVRNLPCRRETDEHVKAISQQMLCATVITTCYKSITAVPDFRI